MNRILDDVRIRKLRRLQFNGDNGRRSYPASKDNCGLRCHTKGISEQVAAPAPEETSSEAPKRNGSLHGQPGNDSNIATETCSDPDGHVSVIAFSTGSLDD